MTGRPDWNQAAFNDAEKHLTDLGYDVVNPARHGFERAGMTWEDYARLGLLDLLSCNVVVVLPEWNESKGATLEVFVARSLNMPVWHLEAVEVPPQ
jgi:hypothetical protein